MFTILGKKFLKLWMRQFKKKQIVPTVRGVFLGDAVSLYIMMDGVYSKDELDILEQYIFPKLPHLDLALDIGANIGNHAVTFSNTFKNVKAYEINKRVFHILQSNCVNRSVEPINCGLSDKEKVVFFEENYGNLGGSSIVECPKDNAFTVEVRTLDHSLTDAEKAQVSFVKIDVEGHELNVLKGGKDFFPKYKPVLAFEGFFKSNPDLGDEIQRLLSSWGYSEFLELEPKYGFIRFCQSNFPRPIFNVLKLVLPQKKRQNLRLSKTDRVAGKDHALMIASAFPILD